MAKESEYVPGLARPWPDGPRFTRPGRMVRGADERPRRSGARRCETTRLTFTTARIGAGGQNFEVVTWLSPRTE
jgi:hypothetical protein